MLLAEAGQGASSGASPWHKSTNFYSICYQSACFLAKVCGGIIIFLYICTRRLL